MTQPQTQPEITDEQRRRISSKLFHNFHLSRNDYSRGHLFLQEWAHWPVKVQTGGEFQNLMRG